MLPDNFSGICYHGTMLLSSIRQLAMRFFKVSSYLLTALDWLWCVMLTLPLLMKSDFIKLLIPENAPPVKTVAAQSSISPTILVIGIITTIIMVLLTLVLMWRLPKAILKTGDTISHTVTDVVLPVIVHHKKMPVKKQRVLSARLLVYVRLLLLILPVAGVALLPASANLEKNIGIAASAITALVGVVCLLAEYAIAATLRKPKI